MSDKGGMLSEDEIMGKSPVVHRKENAYVILRVDDVTIRPEFIHETLEGAKAAAERLHGKEKGMLLVLSVPFAIHT